MSKVERQPLDNSKLPGRYRAFHIESFDPRADGLVYSSDGVKVRIQTGLDADLQVIADMQLDAAEHSDVDAEDAREDMGLEVMAKRLERENKLEIEFERTLLADTNTGVLRTRAAILRQIREMPGLDAI